MGVGEKRPPGSSGVFCSSGNLELQREGVNLHKINTMALRGELLSNQGKVSLDQFKINQEVLLTKWLSKRGEMIQSSACSLLPSRFYR